MEKVLGRRAWIIHQHQRRHGIVHRSAGQTCKQTQITDRAMLFDVRPPVSVQLVLAPTLISQKTTMGPPTTTADTAAA
jgi:hypothetical protein